MPRIVTFAELESWLCSLPWWEDEISDAGAVPSFGAGPGGGTSVSSPVEREAIDLAELSTRVQLIRTVLRRLPDDLQQFAQIRYLARTATMGHSMRQTCDLIGISRSYYYRMREQILTQVLAEIYISRLDPGAPFSLCHQDPVPKELRG